MYWKISFIFSLLLICVASDELNTSTKRARLHRRTTTTTLLTTENVNTEEVETKEQATNVSSTLDSFTESTVLSSETKYSNETIKSKESSIITGLSPVPSIAIEITTKKSLRVRNCGERIGDDIPFMAVIVHTSPYDTSSKKKRSLSKGVLISENYVLTTVSSIYHSEPYWTVSSVRLGDFITWNKYATRDKSSIVEIDVDEIFYHKKKDIALIKLKESVNFTDLIRPSCLPSSDGYNFKELKSHLCKRSSHNKIPADVTLEFAAPLSSFDCKQFFTRKRMSISQQEFCVWDETGDDCAGDIGNSLFTIHNGRFFVVGLRSYAETDEEFDDPSEFPGVYVKIGSFLDWISAVMNSNNS